jgi:predicted dehydrogenase
MSRIKAAVVGLGYWGPNLARNFQASNDFELVGLCDPIQPRLDKVGEGYPWAKRFTGLAEMLEKAKPELVAVATPVGSHHGLVKPALEAGCHVLCEKPLASTVAEATEMVETAARLDRRLFVDHTFTYTGAVRAIRDLYAQKKLGDLFYVDSVRINLGLFQPDVDVVWDLAPHDLSILNYVVGRKVRSVSAHGTSHNPRGLADVAYLTVEYDGGLSAYMHLSWLSPVKVRRMIFSCTSSSLIYDDLEASEKIRIYDHGVSFEVSDLETRKQVLVNYRRGDMRAPAIDNKEALGVEAREIAAALRGGPLPPGTGEAGLDVVRVLEAAGKSLAAGGARVLIF